jgi:hypothetical protein
MARQPGKNLENCHSESSEESSGAAIRAKTEVPRLRAFLGMTKADTSSDR